MFLKKGATTLSFFITLLTSVILLVISSACDKSPEKDKKEVLKNEIKIDLSTERLPINFKGDDIEEIYEKLKSKKPDKKGEYETTEEWKRKIDDNYQSILNDDTIYFIKNWMKLHYDADKQNFIEYFRLESGFGLNNMFLSIRWDRVNKSYIAQNAFGAKVPITLEETTKYYIVPLNKKDIVKNDAMIEKYYKMHGVGHYDMVIELPVSRENAKQSSIYALIVFKPRLLGTASDYTFVTERSTRKPPSWESPSDLQSKNYFIFGDLLEIWIYDSNSGEIISKYKPLFGK
jgi:hypothetical protein